MHVMLKLCSIWVPILIFTFFHCQAIRLYTQCDKSNFAVLLPRTFISGIQQSSVVYYQGNISEGAKILLNAKIGSLSCIVEGKLDKVENNLSLAILNHTFPDGLADSRVQINVQLYEKGISTGENKLRTIFKSLKAQKKLLIFETNKPIYRPGEKINARFLIFSYKKVFALRTHSNFQCSGEKINPTSIKPIIVLLKDIRGRIVKQWTLFESTTLAYELLPDAKEGNWHFSYGEKGSKMHAYNFDVKHYILPRYTIIKEFIEVPTTSKTTDYKPNIRNDITLSVCAKYTTGLYFKGTLSGKICLCIDKMDKTSSSEEKDECKTTKYCKEFSGELKYGCVKLSTDVKSWRTENGDLLGVFKAFFTIKERSSPEVIHGYLSVRPKKATAQFIYKTGINTIALPILVSVNKPSHNKKHILVLKTKTSQSMYEINNSRQQIVFAPVQGDATVSLMEANENKEFKAIETKTLPQILTAKSLIYFDHSYSISEINCPGSAVLHLLSNKNLAGKTVFITSQNGGRNIMSKHHIKTSNFCQGRNDQYGHFVCENSDRVCMNGWTGVNCMQKKCACQNNCLCTTDGSCRCDENLKFGRLPRAKDGTIFFAYKISIELTSEYGPEFRGTAYYFDTDFDIVATPILLEGLNGCASEANVESIDKEGAGIHFDKEIVSPGHTVELRVAYGTKYSSMNDICYLQAYDEGMQTLFRSNEDFGFTISKYLTAWRNYLKLYQKRSFKQRPNTLPSQIFSFNHGFVDLIRKKPSDCFFKDSNYKIPFRRPSFLKRPGLPGPRQSIRRRPSRRKKKRKDKDMISEEEEEVEVPPPRLREYFPESWIFSNYSISDYNGITKMKTLKVDLKAPDTITKWHMFSYCVTEKEGLYIPPDKALLTVDKPFHIEIKLPKETKRGEVLHLPVVIFFESEELKQKNNFVKLTASWNGEDFVALAGQTINTCVGPVSQDNGALFILKPNHFGKLNITISASAKINHYQCTGKEDRNESGIVLSDALVKPLRVVPEGNKQEKTQTILACIKENEVYRNTVNFKIPLEDIVNDSLKVYVAVSGDVLSVAGANLGSLVKKPTGCGEQNMILVSPSVSVLQYLMKKQTKKGTEEDNFVTKLKNKAIEFIEVGYSGELNYRHDDGSFSAFGMKDDHGSTWLTSFVLTIFAEAKQFVPNLDMDSMFIEGLKFLQTVYDTNKCFIENGRVIQSEMTGKEKYNDSISGLSLSLDVLKCLQLMLINDVFSKTVHNEELLRMISRAESCVLENYLKTDASPETLGWLIFSKLSYTASLLKGSDHSLGIKSSEFDKIIINSSITDNTKSLKWWGDKNARKEIIIQTTSYAFLAVEEYLDLSDRMNVIRWILSQQSKTGGFYSTQDTVVALKAISRFVLTKLTEPGLTSSVHEETLNLQKEIKVVPNEANLLKEYLVSEMVVPTKENLNFNWEVKGVNSIGCLQILTTLIYHTYERLSNTETEVEAFLLDHVVAQESHKNNSECRAASLTFSIRRNFEVTEEIGMVIAIITVPTSYSVDENALKELVESKSSSAPVKYGIHEVNGAIQLYFNSFDSQNIDDTRSASVVFNQEFYVENLQPSRLIIEDYYNGGLKIEKQFNLSDCKASWIYPEVMDDDLINKNCESLHNDEIKEGKVEHIVKTICESPFKYTIGLLNSEGGMDLKRLAPQSQFTVSVLHVRTVKNCTSSKEASKEGFSLRIFHHRKINNTVNYHLLYHLSDNDGSKIISFVRNALRKIAKTCFVIIIL